jgi:hypothetical protein
VSLDKKCDLNVSKNLIHIPSINSSPENSSLGIILSEEFFSEECSNEEYSDEEYSDDKLSYAKKI